MTLTMTEAQLQAACVSWARTLGAPELVVASCPNEDGGNPSLRRRSAAIGMMPGFPDMMLFCGGRVQLIEFKTESGQLSQSQLTAHLRLRNAGFNVAVIRTVQDFAELLVFRKMANPKIKVVKPELAEQPEDQEQGSVTSA